MQCTSFLFFLQFKHAEILPHVIEKLKKCVELFCCEIMEETLIELIKQTMRIVHHFQPFFRDANDVAPPVFRIIIANHIAFRNQTFQKARDTSGRDVKPFGDFSLRMRLFGFAEKH